MVKRLDGRPVHEQVAARLRARIMAGDYAPGTQLPSTAHLVAEYEVAGTTVQKALRALKQEGYLVSRQGKGVFVRDRQPFRVDVAAYFAPSPGGYQYELLEVAEGPPPAEVATELKFGPDDRAVMRKRLLRHDGEPVELSHSYYPLDLVHDTDLTRPGRINGGAPRVLAELGFPEEEFVDRVSSREPTPDEIELLELPAVPVIRQFRVTYSRDRRPVEASVLIKGSHLYELVYRQLMTT